MYYNTFFSKVNHLQPRSGRFPGHFFRPPSAPGSRLGHTPAWWWMWSGAQLWKIRCFYMGHNYICIILYIICIILYIICIILYNIIYMLYVSVIFYSYAIRCITVGISCVYVTCNACIHCNLFGWFSLILHTFLMFIRSQVQTLPCGHCCCHRFARLRCHFLRRKPSPRFMDRSRWRYA